MSIFLNHLYGVLSSLLHNNLEVKKRERRGRRKMKRKREEKEKEMRQCRDQELENRERFYYKKIESKLKICNSKNREKVF